ncbi:UDP-N-acetylmuramate dehydrogenase [Cobetia sp. 14N.309.X.WAT.E.A4]|uniref:UDP-N-acetylmuramate dehydrogenase n=1 Tax=Cobetia sp. 14N.309.X.WAT.E.A4 TaxID=2998323 RepID=UPI0025AF8578|nr:UDP-N-acetylmuramate dehydrogenase [Cobetia sp. 14N.309.X.WAT.E.A4]MDN2655060.1 UDP-N-acetylmuramate dehydrogenase [Cobetia sp. 14N.309.X.WAT.E.A4]
MMAPDKSSTRASLTACNTLGFAATARTFSEPRSVAEARRQILDSRAADERLVVIGGGSNLVLLPWLDAHVMRPAFEAMTITPAADGRTATVSVEAGKRWHALVMELATAGWWGYENLALIPGCCGAAPIQNIGAYGVELADHLLRLEVMSLEDGSTRWLSREECAFGYRDSLFKGSLEHRVLITRLEFVVTREATPQLAYGDLAQRVNAATPQGEAITPLSVANAVIATRSEKLPDPAVLGNAGSFFKNPQLAADEARELLAHHPTLPHYPQADGSVKLAAGWLIDQCGLKGARRGYVGVHDRQALVLVHFGGGQVSELLALAQEVRESVHARFGVWLEQEPRVLGEMAATPS